MKSFFLCIPILFVHALSNNILNSNRPKRDLFTINKEDFIGGMDMRNIATTEEPSIEHLIYIHSLHRLYLRLCNEDYSLKQKEEWAKDYLELDTVKRPDMLAGGLMDDWNFELF